MKDNEETIRLLNLVCDGVETPTEEEEQETLEWQEDNPEYQWVKEDI
jgi:hypothetical protein